MSYIRWKLGEVLERDQITVYRLHQEMEEAASRNTLYRLANETKPDRVDLGITASILEALRKVGGKPYALSDLLEEVDANAMSPAGIPYTGDAVTDELLDNPEYAGRLLTHKREFAPLGPEERRAKLEAMLESGDLIPLEQVLAELEA